MKLTEDVEYKQFLVNSLVRYFPDVDFHLLGQTAFAVLRERNAGKITADFVECVRLRLLGIKRIAARLDHSRHSDNDRWSYSHDPSLGHRSNPSTEEAL